MEPFASAINTAVAFCVDRRVWDLENDHKQPLLTRGIDF